MEYNKFDDIGFYPQSLKVEMCSNFVFLTKKKQQNAPLACEVCVFLTERNLKLRKIAEKLALRARDAPAAHIYIYRS